MLTLRPFPRSAAIADYYESCFKEMERDRPTAAGKAGKSGTAKAVALISQLGPRSGDPSLHPLMLAQNQVGAARPAATSKGRTGKPLPVRR